MPTNTFSWASQIEKAKEATDFEPLAPGTYNFRVEKPQLKTFDDGNTVINYRARVMDGERAKSIQFDKLDPYNQKYPFIVKNFLDFFEAIGFSKDLLLEQNPSLEQIAGAIEGREFTADVILAKKTDQNGVPYRNLGNFRRLGHNPNADQADASSEPEVATGFGDTPAPAPAPASTGFGDSTSQNASSGPENPWG